MVPSLWWLHGERAARSAAGDADEEVDFEEIVGAVRGLRRFGLSPEVMVVPDESHGLGAYRHQVEAYLRTASFFDEHLAPPVRKLLTEQRRAW